MDANNSSNKYSNAVDMRFDMRGRLKKINFLTKVKQLHPLS